MSSIIQVRQQVICRSNSALVFTNVSTCLLCPAYESCTFCVSKSAANDLLKVLLIFKIELVHLFKNGVE